MRRLLALLLGVAVAAPAAMAQTTPPAPRPGSASDRLRAQITLLRLSGEDGRIPPADSFAIGGRTVPADSTVHGSVGVANGALDVRGVLDGDAVAIDGDVVVHRGGVITGDALVVGGNLTLDGGRVDGEIRKLNGLPARRASAVKPARTTWQAVKLVLGWFTVLVIIGLGVMIFAESNLDGVVAAMERGVARSFWLGVVGQLAALPVLLVLCVALALTLLGILLIPFAVVSYCIATAGLVTLGFLAAARLTGGAVVPGTEASPRGVHLQALFAGLVLYLGLWLVAAAFTWSPLAGAVLRGVAMAVSWVAATIGLGATLASRAGTRRPTARPAHAAADDLSWQTPTPVVGVAAARRGPPLPPSAASLGDLP